MILLKYLMLWRNFDMLDDGKKTTEVLIIQRNFQNTTTMPALSAIEM